DWFATAEAALEGGADCLQLREKDLPDRELLGRARRLGDFCREHGALFIVNDRPDLAVLSGADGVHLGQDDVTVSQARRIMPSTAIIGVSTHTLEQFDEAIAQAPDYIALGPMFPTATKPQDYVAGPEMLAEASSRTSLPLVAIGGINNANAGQVLSRAWCSLCVCSAVVAQTDVAAATARLSAVLDRGAGPVAPDTRPSGASSV
ncbi:MAG: thiamine phosphate synthase, partial [Planctomycetes bacterium]|nr:thiamine phosphate synthase [Planctomycetota bacterium]